MADSTDPEFDGPQRAERRSMERQPVLPSCVPSSFCGSRAPIGAVRRNLDQIDAVTGLDDLRVPTATRLLALVGDLAGQSQLHFTRLNDGPLGILIRL